jgi:hypothetical protein
MFLATEMLILSLVVMTFAPDIPISRALRHWLIEAPANALSKLTPMKLIVGLIVLVFLVGWAMSAPEIVAMIGIGDLSAYLDAVVIMALMGAATRLKFVLSEAVRHARTAVTNEGKLLSANRARNRQPRLRRSRSFPSRADDEPHAAWAFAAA